MLISKSAFLQVDGRRFWSPNIPKKTHETVSVARHCFYHDEVKNEDGNKGCP